jgi:hypothetical protein
VDDIEAGPRTDGNTSRSSPPDGTSTVTRWRRPGLAVLGGLVLVCGGLIVASVLHGVLIKSRKAKLDEVTANLYGIKTAQFAHKASSGSFVSAGPHPRKLDELTTAHAEWTAGSGFDIFGWAPTGPVQATYQVEVLPDSLDFIAHAWIDADGDGVPAHFTVTKRTHPERVTPASVR